MFDGTTGAFLHTESFDTYGDVNQTNAMADYIQGLPLGQIVVVVARDAAHAKLNEAAFEALESLGSATIRDMGHRWVNFIEFSDVIQRDSFALIGVKGSPIGSVSEMLSPRYNGPAIVNHTFENGESSFTVHAESSGYDDGNSIFVEKIGNPNPILTLTTNVQWSVGDSIVLASTDFKCNFHFCISHHIILV